MQIELNFMLHIMHIFVFTTGFNSLSHCLILHSWASIANNKNDK